MLTLILQTQEGQQIELNVQPEDTFADLKKQYEDTDGLSESLEQLITNGANVEENTTILEYVTSSAHEWFSADQPQDLEFASSRLMDLETKIKECCASGCSNSEAVTPGKTFFPLPTDHERLSMCLIAIERSDLYNQILGSNGENNEKYFLCADHFGENPCDLPIAIEQSAVSLLKPKNARNPSDANKESKCAVRDTNSALDASETLIDFQHPGILCRLCGETTANPIRLYADKESNLDCSIADKINLCLPVTVTVTDPLPKQICEDCQVKLNACHELAVSSLQTEDKLTLLLREKKLCANNTTEHQCPLCLEGDMQIVKKSGIYRKEDLKNDYNNFNDSIPPRDTTVIFEDSNDYNDDISDVRIAESSLLPVPNGEFCCSVCNEKLMNVTAIRTHECPKERKISSYNCVICKNTNFTYPHELEVHYRRHGMTEDTFFCELCGYSCDALDEAAKHVTTCRPEFWEIRCAACDKTFPNVKIMSDHNCYRISLDFLVPEVIFSSEPEVTKKSPKKRQPIRYDCHFCRKQFTRKGSLQKHISLVHGESMDNPPVTKCYKCKSCNEAFAHETDAEEHINVRHLGHYVSSDLHSVGNEFATDELSIGSLYTCEYCERCFTTPSALHDHREVEHDKTIRYFCPQCADIFDSHKQLAAHKSLHSHRKALDDLAMKQLYLCKYCDKTFLHRSTLASHELQHPAISPYLCRPCNLRFETYREVATHRDIVHPYQSELHESASRAYKCQYCEKLFSHEVVLVKHTRMHTGERPHKCTICGKGFSQSSGLYTHMKIHSDLRPYNCPKCPRTFKIKGDRDNHVKKHSGNRPYKCEFCSKAFMTQHVYSQHRRIHTNERPYKCDICGEAFRRSYVLTVHMRRHTGEKPHSCDICPKTYRQRGDLVKHRKSQHGIIVSSASEIVFPKKLDDNSYDSFTKSSNKIIEGRVGNSLLLTL